MAAQTSVSAARWDRGLLRRSVLGDGACFYRACLFAALEQDYARSRRQLARWVDVDAAVLPKEKPRRLVEHFSRNDDAMCDLARAAARGVLRHGGSDALRAWLGQVDDAESVAHQADRDLAQPRCWASCETMGCLAEALDVSVALMFRPERIVLPPGRGAAGTPNVVCLMPLVRTAGSVAGHYDIAYPGTLDVSRSRVVLDPASERTLAQ